MDGRLAQLMADGYQAFEAQDWPRAGELLARAAPDLAPDRCAATWFDAALAYKFARDWPRAYELGKRAAALASPGEQDPAYWNLGIAATMLRDWSTARRAWAGFGIALPPGEGEIEADFGVTCVRIDTGHGQEVVWARRLCPTRARVLSVPFHPARRFGEVVLHDGAPNGERVVDGRSTPVFDEIALFAPSELATLSVTVTAADPADTRALCDAFERADFGAEALSSRVQLCACCSEGTVRQEPSWAAGRQGVLLGAPVAAARRLLDAWRDERPDQRGWSDLHVLPVQPPA